MATLGKLSKRIISTAVVALAVVPLTTGCVGKPASEYERNSAAQCPFPVSDVSGSVRLGYQVIPGKDLFIHNEGLLEACLPHVDVTWTRFPTGQDVVQGFAANSADIGFLGSTPTAKALSAPLNLDVIVPEINLINKSSEALVAKKASSIEELKGKTIATAFSSTSHFSLLKALEFAGLDPRRDVHIVNISPDKLPAAWNSNEIDAAFIWNPTLSQLQQTGNTIVDAGAIGSQGAPTFNDTMVSRKWAENNPEVLRTWLKLSNWASQVYRDDPNRFFAANAAQTGLDTEEIKRQLAAVQIVPTSEQEEQRRKAARVLYDTAVFLQEQDDVRADTPQHYEAATQTLETGD